MNTYSNRPNAVVMDGRFLLVCQSHWNLVVSLDEIDHGEIFSSVESCGKVKDDGKGIPIVLGGQMQPAVISTWSP